MSILAQEAVQSIEDLGFTVSTWKTLRRHGVSTIDDLTMLISMPCWATRLLQCGKRTAWEIAMKISEKDLADEGELLRVSGYRFTEQEMAFYRDADKHLVWIPMPHRGRNLSQGTETGV